MNRHIVGRGLIVVAVLSILTVGLYGWLSSTNTGQTRSAFDVDVPSGQGFVNGNTSAHFEFEATVKLGDTTPAGMRSVTFDVLVKNKTQEPIRHLTVGGILDDQVVEALETPIPFFGTATDENYSLIPGQIPYGIYVTRIAYIVDPERLAPNDKEELLRTLHAPIRLKIRWDSGVEYIQVQPVVSS